MNFKKNIIKKIIFILIALVIIVGLYFLIEKSIYNYNSSKNFQQELENKNYNGYKVVVQISKNSKVKSFYQIKGYAQLTNLLEIKYGYFVKKDPHGSGNSKIGAITKDKAIIYIAPQYSKEEIAYFLTTPKVLFKKLNANNKWVETGLTNNDIKKADLITDNDKWAVYVEFNEQGTKKFAEITQELIGKSLGIFFADQLETAPIINEQITTGTAQISTAEGMSYDDANNIKNAIKHRLDLDILEIQENK